jgi:ribosomal protein S18 acetylase RimI-like enzyme
MALNNITVREAQTDDASQLLALKRGYIEGCTTIPLYIDEYKNDETQERALIARYLAEENSVLLVAEYNGQLIGNLDLTGNQRRKLYHTGMVGMGIANSWQGRGVGSLLMQAALGWAKANDYLKIIWLEVYATNTAGLHLYKKYGFQECGLIKGFVIEQQPVDKITMVQYL